MEGRSIPQTNAYRL